VDSQTDSALMKQVQDGDTVQVALLFERYHGAIFGYLLRLSGNRALSEDLTQEVFFRVIKFAKHYDPKYTFRVWLYGMARNAHIDSQRKLRREVPDDPLREWKSDEPMPEELATRKQDAQFLQEALRQLPADKREVLILSRFQNLRHDEISRILQCEVGAVKVRVYRALKELRLKFWELRGERAYDA
jgi:RNA polymerase sigma factor (sigma-70 family)